jgi:glycosyltransferase involved in cell wall biosynthesis
MAAGTPVIATTVGGMPEIIRDHHTGLLIPPANESALGSAILELYEDPRLRSDLVFSAQLMRASRFNAATMVEKYVECYRKLVGIPETN